jgi:hypothetical protein
MPKITESELDVNPLQMETLHVLDSLFDGRFQLFGMRNRATEDPDAVQCFAVGTPDFVANVSGHGKPFAVTTDGRIQLLNGDFTPAENGGDLDPLHFGVFVMSYTSLNPADDPTCNEDFLEAAHDLIHLGDKLTIPIPTAVTIEAVRMRAVQAGLL